jgi:hypothetical protein
MKIYSLRIGMVVALEFVWSSMRIFDYLFCRHEFWSHTSPRDLARVRSSKAAYSETRNERGKKNSEANHLVGYAHSMLVISTKKTHQVEAQQG